MTIEAVSCRTVKPVHIRTRKPIKDRCEKKEIVLRTIIIFELLGFREKSPKIRSCSDNLLQYAGEKASTPDGGGVVEHSMAFVFRGTNASFGF